jgi:hypothetical protein
VEQKCNEQFERKKDILVAKWGSAFQWRACKGKIRTKGECQNKRPKDKAMQKDTTARCTPLDERNLATIPCFSMWRTPVDRVREHALG